MQAIGSYRLIETLGKGSFGVVYQAYQPFLDRYVAIKMLHSDFGPGSGREKHFMDEARTIARLRHPNIVSVYEFGTIENSADQDSQTYMVMEYLPGHTLQERLRGGVLTIPDILTIIEQIAGALDYAHARGIVHRDLKPANILFTDADQPVIVDFGLAQLIQAGRVTITDPEASTISGTLAYMAPEQMVGEKTGSFTDQYALAVIAYEMLTHTRLFDQLDSATKILTRIDAAHETIEVSLPKNLLKAEPIFAQALATNPTNRFATAGAFAQELVEVLQPDRQTRRSVLVSDPQQVAQIRAVRQTITGFLWGIAAIVLLVLAFGTAIWIRGYVNGTNVLFLWDGVIARHNAQSGLNVVTGIWPNGAAEQAGVQLGDTFKDDLLNNYNDRNGDYTVNDEARALLPASWEPHLGDVIKRTIGRNGQPIVITYTISHSWYALFLLVLYVIPSALAFIVGIWLLRRWGPEPGVRVIFPLLLSASFWLLTQVLARVIPYMDTVAANIVLPSVLLFIMMFPEPLPILTRRRWLIWLLYVPLIGPLIEFLIGAGIPLPIGGLEIQFVLYIGYSLAIIPVIYLKWIRRDLKHYRSLRGLIGAFLLIPIAVVPAAIINALDFPTSRALFGSDVGVRLTAYGFVSLTSTLIVILVWRGYQRLQAQIGPSFLMRDTPEAR